jgi:hypothetical protein
LPEQRAPASPTTSSGHAPLSVSPWGRGGLTVPIPTTTATSIALATNRVLVQGYSCLLLCCIVRGPRGLSRQEGRKRGWGPAACAGCSGDGVQGRQGRGGKDDHALHQVAQHVQTCLHGEGHRMSKKICVCWWSR